MWILFGAVVFWLGFIPFSLRIAVWLIGLAIRLRLRLFQFVIHAALLPVLFTGGAGARPDRQIFRPEQLK